MKINIADISKNYGERKVVSIDKVDFKPKQIHGIIGGNGAGKSTLLKIIGNLVSPDTGQIAYDNSSFSEAVNLEMTYLWQSPRLFRTTVFENIMYPLKFRKVDYKLAVEQVNGIMKELKISHLADKKATTLSGGEAQRVALARALVFKPKVLLLDEPTASIDPNSLELVEKVILKYKRELTILLVTHNVSQADRMCDTISFMEEGRIIEFGSKEEVLKNSSNPLVRRFMKQEYII